MRLLLLIAAGLPLAAQTWTIGTAADPCAGGSPLVIAGAGNTVRWDSAGFICTFPIAAAGVYVVEMQFLEPCFAAGACAAGQVVRDGRLLAAYVNDQPALAVFDPVVAGATDAAAAARSIVVYAAPPAVTVRLQTMRRAAVLSRVTITPLAAPAASAWWRVMPDASGYEWIGPDDILHATAPAGCEVIAFDQCNSATNTSETHAYAACQLPALGDLAIPIWWFSTTMQVFPSSRTCPPLDARI
jgi:hypothetical protein